MLRPRKEALMKGAVALSVATLVTGLWAGSAPAHDEPGALGQVRFPTSCGATVQPVFERGVALLHSFWYEEALKTFTSVTTNEPGCAMGYWGMAMSVYYPLWQPPSEAMLAKGRAALDRAAALNATPREKDYVAALATFYRDADKLDHRTRAVAYEKAMEQLATRYPEDREASVFYALALDATAPPTDKTYANQLKAAAILEKVFAVEPNHPGVAHYLIHSYDAAPLPTAPATTARRRRHARSPRRAATRRSPPRCRTRCTCPRTSSRGSGSGRSPSIPTWPRPRPARRTWPSRAAPSRGISRCTPRTTWPTATCRRGATSPRGAWSRSSASTARPSPRASPQPTRWRRRRRATRSSGGAGAKPRRSRCRPSRSRGRAIPRPRRSWRTRTRWARRARATWRRPRKMSSGSRPCATRSRRLRTSTGPTRSRCSGGPRRRSSRARRATRTRRSRCCDRRRSSRARWTSTP